MSLTRYRYRNVISGFFELPTDNARRILPAHLEAAELHHGSSILSVTAFEFTESEVGAYEELVFSLIVPPLVKPGERLPKSAFYPFQVATTTRAAREHAIERWHLPHWMEDVEVEFIRQGGVLTARVRAGADPVAELSVAEYAWSPVRHLYQSFMKDEDGAYLAKVLMEGEESEHEEETGRLHLFEHPFNKHLDLAEVSDVPFREVWMRDGQQTFEPLIQLEIV